MNNRLFPLLLALLLLLGGCQLAQPEAATASETDLTDLLVGVMLTPQPLDLFDLESYISDHGVPEDGAVLGGSGDYRQRLYAADLGGGRWQFEGVEGFAFFSVVVTDEHGSYSTMVNDGLADGSYAVHETDEGTSTDISCTLYVQPAEQICWYFNPVYQDGDGRVYLLPGSGTSMSGDNPPGMQISQTLTGRTTTADERGVTHSCSTRCAITVSVQALPRQVRLFWMDGGSRILRQETYAPGQLPKQLDGCGAAYLIAELEDSTGAVVRSLIQPDEDHPASLRSYAPGQWGALAAIDTPVDWD